MATSSTSRTVLRTGGRIALLAAGPSKMNLPTNSIWRAAVLIVRLIVLSVIGILETSTLTTSIVKIALLIRALIAHSVTGTSSMSTLMSRHFKDEGAYEQHCANSAAHRAVYCDLCDVQFDDEDEFDEHCRYDAAHRTCNICNAVCATVERYEKHMAKVHGGSHQHPIDCNFCDKCFKTPSAFAQHVESGVHGVSRHQVTKAVQMLRVVPQITLTPTIEFDSTSRIEQFEPEGQRDVELESGGSPSESSESLNSPTESCDDFEDVVDGGLTQGPFETSVEPGPPLGPREMRVAVSSSIIYPNTYVPDDFINLGIPYACSICFKTFRTVFALTAHMNSPVHDPDAFLCPKCNKQFVVVSGLIQHLESGCCNLASPGEIFSRFARLTARFSRLLTA
ncbi:hypothetical protein EST38_g13367 [Candolleomyces aberdarensis]|uniref:C2H2-type domain-containing protein n=1 Tax=Candolleomyces aberdarensis TaxID=2316362 RepID=A0A4Q2D1Z8_9AGAR|nr:hypothetical protein EST38_g13367 [Candolleomyces aberdarensis]